MNDPTLPIWGDAIETLVTLGELEQAGAYLEPYERQRATAREPAGPWQGLPAAAAYSRPREGDLPAAVAAFERALTEQDEPRMPFERARTLLCLGAVRRQAQQKQAAREALEQALAIFEELGRPPLGGEGPGGARADQRPAGALRRS